MCDTLILPKHADVVESANCFVLLCHFIVGSVELRFFFCFLYKLRLSLQVRSKPASFLLLVIEGNFQGARVVAQAVRPRCGHRRRGSRGPFGVCEFGIIRLKKTYYI